MKLHDTITAIATPIGSGGIAILRLSGSQAEEIATRVVSPLGGKTVAELENYKLTLSMIHACDNPEAPIDRALAVVMRAPRSYTGETVVEIHCHGGFFAASRILEELLKSGARLAEGGEFTRRAFLNGKTDLTGAEATMDLIDAHSALGLGNAARALKGQLFDAIEALREQVIAVTSHISAAADYPEEVDIPQQEHVLLQFATIKQEIDRLLGTFETGRLLKEGITTVIVGRPNVGKSSLLNALTRSDRAIVTDIPGTTRDVIEEYLQLGGVSLRLLDTAGLRSREDADAVEQLGMDRTMEQMQEADLCLFLVDATGAITEEDLQIAAALKGKQTLLLLNKTDQPEQVTVAGAAEAFSIAEERILKTATPKDGKTIGLEALEQAICGIFLEGKLQPGEVYLSNARQRDSLLKAADALSRATEALKSGMPYDLLYVDLEDVLSALGEVTGVTVQEEIIEQVFARFCVGK
ncbi:MAG: tRNA uridine-5-carboxymethylaminomethyl(34) synthesis GTPase MnmE [Clostridia bacterium]|nr:tRNA uridine-5-carboxymethylaminomethyl(34) synthesis GTPase MnmE [Clostridia bacterium]